MNGNSHVQALLNIARRDLKAAKAMLDPDDFEDPVFGFQIQQAVEKLFKAWLTLKGVTYAKTHDLENLAELLIAAGVEISEMMQDKLSDITLYAVTMRYMDTPFLDEPIDRMGLLDLVESLISKFEQTLQNH